MLYIRDCRYAVANTKQHNEGALLNFTPENAELLFLSSMFSEATGTET